MKYVREIALCMGIAAFALLANYGMALLGNPQSIWALKLIGLM